MNQAGVRSTCSSRQARTRTGSVTLELDRELVVQAAEDERAEQQRERRGHDDVGDLAHAGVLAVEERAADRLDERRGDVSPAQKLHQRVVILNPWQRLQVVEDRGEKEPGQQDG